jgi:hypothetical protein
MAVTVLGEQLQLFAICLAEKVPADASRKISLMFFMDILLAMRITPFMIDFTIIVRGSADKISRNRKEKCPDKTGIRVRLIPETMSNKNRNTCPDKIGTGVQQKPESVSS